MEHKIIAAVAADRGSFERINSHLANSDLSPEGGQVYKEIRKFYSKDANAQHVDLDIVQSAVVRRLTNPKHNELFVVYFQHVASQDVSSINVVDEVIAAKRKVAQMNLADAILSSQDEQIDLMLDKVEALRASETLDDNVHEEYQGLAVEALSPEFDQEHLIKVAPQSLNRRLGGGLLRGTHMVVVARPEAGKTLMVLTMVDGFVRCGRKVLYIGNEDPIKSVVMRLITNITNMSSTEVLQQPQQAMSLAVERGYENAVFAGLSGGTLDDVRSLCTKHRPDVLIVDQIRNLATKAENRTNQLETVARGMRNFAREFDLLSISVTQAGDSASGKLVLDMGDIDGSNTGIPGACDVLLMAGMNESYDQQNIRMLKLAKNKASGRHDEWTVSIDKVHSRIRDLS